MSEFFVRRVVTGFDATGAEVFTHDGQAPNTFDAGPVGVSELLWTDGSGLRIADDPDRTTPGFPLEPPAGGISVRVIRMPGIPPGTEADETWLRVDGDDPEVAGMHATDTLDLMVVLEGSVVLGLDDGERTVSAGEYVIQRGTRHRWRPADHRGWTYMVAMLRPVADRADGLLPDGIRPPTAGDSPVRRVVTGEVAARRRRGHRGRQRLLHPHRPVAHRRAAAGSRPGRRHRRRLGARAGRRAACRSASSSSRPRCRWSTSCGTPPPPSTST